MSSESQQPVLEIKFTAHWREEARVGRYCMPISFATKHDVRWPYGLAQVVPQLDDPCD